MALDRICLLPPLLYQVVSRVLNGIAQVTNYESFVEVWANRVMQTSMTGFVRASYGSFCDSTNFEPGPETQ